MENLLKLSVIIGGISISVDTAKFPTAKQYRGGSVVKRKPPGSVPTVKTPTNVERVSVAQLVHMPINWQLVGCLSDGFCIKIWNSIYTNSHVLLFLKERLTLLRKTMKRLWWWTIRHIYFLNVTTTEQNSCFWAMENPRSLHQHLLFAIHYDVYQRGIIGPYCFEKDATVTSPTYSLGYMSMTETFFIMQLRRRIININAWFQQDTRLMLEWRLLQDCSLISFPFGEVPRPPPVPRAWQMWRYLKVHVHQSKLWTFNEFKNSIRK